LASEHIDQRPYSSVNAGLQALKAGKLDAFAYDRPIQQFNVRRGFRDDDEVLVQLFAARITLSRLPLGSPLLPELAVAMLEEMRQRRWKKVLQRYLGAD
jgi:polar amino acid transport system substrate-binding protein